MCSVLMLVDFDSIGDSGDWINEIYFNWCGWEKFVLIWVDVFDCV